MHFYVYLFKPAASSCLHPSCNQIYFAELKKFRRP